VVYAKPGERSKVNKPPAEWETRLKRAETYPEYLFNQLDDSWQKFAKEVEQRGFSLGTTIFCQPITGTLGKSTNRLHCAIWLFKTGMRRLLLREEWLRAKQRKQQGLGRIETRRVYEDLRRVKPSYHGHYVNLVYCDSAYTEDSGFSFSPVQQFSVTLWHSTRLNHDSTIIAGDSARVFERV
jgi:hypothetical protein